MTHLSEEERQGLADGTLTPERVTIARSHVAGCTNCAIDVDRLARVVRRLRSLDPCVHDARSVALWPALRAHLEERRLMTRTSAVPASPEVARLRTSRIAARRLWFVAAAAAVLAIAGVIFVRHRPITAPVAVTPMPTVSGATAAVSTAPISTEDIQRLLDEVELQKAMLPPARAALTDSDVQALNRAVRELRDALARDPGNPALRQLLAEALEQQGDLITRMRNGS